MVVRCPPQEQAPGLAGPVCPTALAKNPPASSRTALADLEGAIGSRGEETCRLLWQRIPKRYKRCLLYSDFWDAYQKVLPDEQHEAKGKGAGQTCHITPTRP